ncbi:hypothetical protein F503_02571 [Ophiostoma piceae UAMH 11346]|uniref:Uncharacterized protein n=1 Tax=Ophiostoma piceae (strain UAMH 11346) TaxID=1262450 RepID=S3CJ43_OPHP1|nr:hypothetical protein F503_02571 [Ophiostoma piceae UAMH 11346]
MTAPDDEALRRQSQKVAFTQGGPDQRESTASTLGAVVYTTVPAIIGWQSLEERRMAINKAIAGANGAARTGTGTGRSSNGNTSRSNTTNPAI